MVCELSTHSHGRMYLYYYGRFSTNFQFMNFLERLARALNMDEISHDIGVDLHTESLLVRAEQLARLESDKLVDKVSYLTDTTLADIDMNRGTSKVHVH